MLRSPIGRFIARYYGYRRRARRAARELLKVYDVIYDEIYAENKAKDRENNDACFRGMG